MGVEKRKQLRLTVTFIVLICIFTGLGLWFRKNPLFTEQGLRRGNQPPAPEATYAPYEPAVYYDADPAAAPAALALPNDGTPISRFYTTARAAVFTFSGLGNEQELQSVLDALKKSGSRATFFVTPEDLETRADQVEQITRAGHSLGIGVALGENAGVNQLLGAMQSEAEKLRSDYRAYYELFVRPTFGSGNAALQQAAAAGGFHVLTELKEAVPEKVSRMTDAREIIAEIFNENDGMLQRGEIVHFQMGLFQYGDTVLGDLVERIAAEKCSYPVVPANAVAEDIENLYQYPLPKDQILREVRNKIYPGHLEGKTPEEIFEVIREGYIGIPWIVSRYFLPGFTDEQARQLEQTGIIENNGNYVFLTFDDWGTDGTVDRLLSVLEKHNATATFFVKTQYVPYNPNLLRAIARAGHTVGAHTHKHIALSNEVQPTYFVELDEQQRKELEEDIVICYDTMQYIIGDLTDADGKPSLSLLFRQPTLAVGRNGLETVFDCGYTHAIAGNYTTTDYKAESAEALAEEVKKNIKPGAVLVMHFSDNAQYTAEAVDMLLTEYEENGSGYQFVGLNKVL